MRVYKIIRAGTSSNLEVEVNESLRDGWELVGGVSVSMISYILTNTREGSDELCEDETWAQAMKQDQ